MTVRIKAHRFEPRRHISSFPLCCETHTQQKQLKVRFTLAPSPRGRFTTVSKAWWQELEAAGPLHLQPRKLAFSLLLSWDSSPQDSAAHIQGLSTSINLSQELPHSYAWEVCLLRWCYTLSSWQSVLTTGGFPLSLGGNRIETSHLDARSFKIVFPHCRIKWLEFISTEHFTSIPFYLYSLPSAKKCLFKWGRAWLSLFVLQFFSCFLQWLPCSPCTFDIQLAVPFQPWSFHLDFFHSWNIHTFISWVFILL